MDTFSFAYPCRYTKSTQNRQLFRIASHLGIHLVTPKALKILNFSGYPLTWVSISLHQTHSKFSTFPGYPLTWVSISLHQKALKILNFSGYLLTWVSISLHQKHSKFSTFQGILSLGYPCRHTKRTQNPQFL